MTDATSQQEEKLEGIGGWLILPMVLLILGIIFLPVGIWLRFHFAKPGHSPIENFHAMAVNPTFQYLAIATLALTAIAVLLELVCLVLFFMKKRIVPTLMITMYVIGIATGVLQTVQFRLDPVLFESAVQPRATPTGMMIGFVIGLVINGGLILYFTNSKRVKNTFVR